MIESKLKILSKWFLWRASFFALCLFVGGCASYPMGLGKTEWNALTPELKAEYRAEQYRIDEERRVRRAELNRQKEAERKAAERAYLEKMDKLRRNVQYGDLVLITLEGGMIELNGKRYPIEPQAFELLKGERRQIKLIGQRVKDNRVWSQYETWFVRFTEDGNTVILNDSPFEHTINLVNDGTWETGQPKALIQQGQLKSGSINLSGMVATVRFKDAPGKPNRLIIEHKQ